ncbi:MAG: polymer-forming cytoskeletal protein, partial [Gammaproteobacteria bacterium]|nr:polymer-forming cytoskeletal protein [Gammaproteobacteria bacterium]
IKARIVVVGGTVEGIIEATEKVELRATAQISGDINSPNIAMATGAVFEGDMHMHSDTRITHFEEQREQISP